MGKMNRKVELLNWTASPEKQVATAARLCYSSADLDELQEEIADRDASSFVKKLMKMGHYSPVEHAGFTFGVEGVSRSLLAQITRHRLASFSVKSQRYVKESGKSGDEVFDYILPPRIAELGEEYRDKFKKQMEQIQLWYDEWLDILSSHYTEDVKEDARFVLPNAAETKFIVTMNARELHHFFNLRCCNRAQWEIRELATDMLRLVKEQAPVLFEEAGPPCVKGDCPEGKASCGKKEEVRKKFKNLV